MVGGVNKKKLFHTPPEDSLWTKESWRSQSFAFLCPPAGEHPWTRECVEEQGALLPSFLRETSLDKGKGEDSGAEHMRCFKGSSLDQGSGGEVSTEILFRPPSGELTWIRTGGKMIALHSFELLQRKFSRL